MSYRTERGKPFLCLPWRSWKGGGGGHSRDHCDGGLFLGLSD